MSNSRSGANLGALSDEVNHIDAECIEIVIDNDDDDNCLSANFQFVGENLGSEGPDFLDAQGKELRIHIRREFLLELPTISGEAKCFRETYLIRSASSPIFAVGRFSSLDGDYSGKGSNSFWARKIRLISIFLYNSDRIDWLQ